MSFFQENVPLKGAHQKTPIPWIKLDKPNSLDKLWNAAFFTIFGTKISPRETEIVSSSSVKR
jgi:hypothetical protein